MRLRTMRGRGKKPGKTGMGGEARTMATAGATDHVASSFRYLFWALHCTDPTLIVQSSMLRCTVPHFLYDAAVAKWAQRGSVLSLLNCHVATFGPCNGCIDHLTWSDCCQTPMSVHLACSCCGRLLVCRSLGVVLI